MRRALMAGGVLLGVLSVLGGCSSEQDAPGPSATPSPTTAPEPSPTVDAEEQEVMDAVSAYYAVRDEAMTTGVLDEAAMREVAEDPYASEALVQLHASVDPGLRMTGAWDYSVEEVSLDGDSATARTCIGLGTVSMMLGEESVSVGNPGTQELTLSASSGAWKVVGNQPGGPCESGAS